MSRKLPEPKKTNAGDHDEAAPFEAVLVFDADSGLFTEADGNAELLFSCTRDEILRSGPGRFYAPVQPDGRSGSELIREYTERTGASDAVVVERMVLNAAGREFLCEVRLVRLPDPDRRLVRAGFIDITACSRVDRAMRTVTEGASAEIGEALFASMATALAKALDADKQAAFLADLVERSSQPFAVGYQDGRLFMTNAAFAELTGYSKEELQTIDWATVLTPPEWRAREQQYLDELKRTGRPVRYEKEYIRKDGSRVPVEILAHLVRDEQGGVKYYCALVTDIAGRKQADALLKKSEELLELFVKHAPAAVAMFDTEMRYILVNPRWLQDYGLVGQDLIGRSHYDVFPEIPDRWKEIHKRCLAGAVEKRDEDPFPRLDGRTDWVRWEIVPWYRRGGEIGGIIMFTEVITGRKQAEENIRKERDFSRAALDSLPGIVYLFDAEGKFLRWNRNFEQMSEYSSEEISRMHPLDFFMGKDRDLIRRKISEAFEKGTADAEAEFVTKSRKHISYYYTGAIIRVEGKPCLVGMGIDITDRKQAEVAANLSRERFRNLVEASSDWVWEVDERAVYTYASPKILDILGYEPSEVLGRTPFDLMPPEEAERVAAVFGDITAARKPFSLLENVNLHKDGRRVVLETSGVPFFDDAGNLRGYRGIDRDITDRKRAEEMIRYQAYHDLLTGLPNRTLFTDLLEHEIREMQRLQKMLAVLFLDVDQFKNVNDSLGHSAGDKLIQHIGAELRSTIREFDAIARIGGDEFTLLLPLINRSEDVSRIADKIMRTFRKPFFIDRNELHLTASVGISLYPADGRDAGSLLKNADIALHYAKDQGRDNYQFFDSSISHRTLEKIILENRLRQAVERGELVVHYQPQQNIKTGTITGAEALVRWNHPDLGMLAPAQFIPLAEEIGLIIEIDRWVLLEVCSRLKTWESAGYALPFITVNLSARQFRQAALAEMIADILQNTGVSPGSIGVEITESLAMQDTDLTVRNLMGLNAMGVRLLIDDFGTGYSSLSYLKKLPIHKLKIDKTFIADLPKSRDDQAITNAIIAMAHILKLEVVAEGVETKEQASFLEKQDCDEMQGNLFSRPLPAEEFEKLLAAV